MTRRNAVKINSTCELFSVTIIHLHRNSLFSPPRFSLDPLEKCRDSDEEKIPRYSYILLREMKIASAMQVLQPHVVALLADININTLPM